MKALNDLHDYLKERRSARRLYRAMHHLDAGQARDVGLYLDHAARRAQRI